MELEFKTTKPSQITWKTKLFNRSSLESKHSFSGSLDAVNDQGHSSTANPLNIEPSYQNLQEKIINLRVNRVLRSICEVKEENEDDRLAVVNEVQTNWIKEIAKGRWLNRTECNSNMMSISDKLMSYGLHHIAPQVLETGVTDQGIIQELVDHDRVIAGGYCRVNRDHDEQGDEEREIIGVVEKPSRLKNLLYLILTVSSLILCLLPRVYGDKIPNLFLPCPWLFYGFNFALMLAAAASLVSIDTMSNIKKVTRCFSDLAILSILTALALFLFSSFLWARCLWAI